MYIAELRGKLSQSIEEKEDILTSNVFSFFKYAPRELFLYSLIKSLGIDITKEDAVNAQFLFWPKYEDNTEPDLVIIIGDCYLLFEDKYLSDFGQETPTTKKQLVRELEGGKNEAKSHRKQFYLIAVTADYFYKKEISKDIPIDSQNYFIWMNWQGIALIIYNILEDNPTLSPETKDFAEDLYSLLLKKNLRSFEGINVLNRIKKLDQTPYDLFFEATTAKYRGDFIGFNRSLSTLKRLPITPEDVFYSPNMELFIKLVELKDNLKTNPSIIFFKEG